MTVCLMKPVKVAMTLLVSSCQRAKASAASGRTRVWVMIVMPSPPGAGVPPALSGRLMAAG